MTDHPNYRAIHVPEGKRNGHEEELTYAERRAYILERLEDAGSPRLLNKSELARTFDVSRQTIYNDLEALAEWSDGGLGERETLEGEALFWRSIDQLLEDAEALRNQGEHAQAAKAEKEAARVFRWCSEWRKAESVESILERLEDVEDRVESGDGLGFSNQ